MEPHNKLVLLKNKYDFLNLLEYLSSAGWKGCIVVNENWEMKRSFAIWNHHIYCVDLMSLRFGLFKNKLFDTNVIDDLIYLHIKKDLNCATFSVGETL